MNDELKCVNSVFEQPWWLELVAPGCWSELRVVEGEETVARLPYCMKRGRIYMPPFTQTLGPWMREDARGFRAGNAQLSRQKELASALFAQLPGFKSFEMCFDSANDYILPYRWLGFRYEPSFSYRLSSLEDPDRLYACLHKTVKKNIRYARNKTTLQIETDPATLIALTDKSFAAQGRKNPSDHALMERIMREAIRREHGRIITAFDPEGHAHASAFLLYDEHVCYYLIGGADPAYRSSGASSLVLWEAIRFAAGVSKAFDFEGSNIEGIEQFFRQFGGERVINYTVSRRNLSAELLTVLKPHVKKILGYRN